MFSGHALSNLRDSARGNGNQCTRTLKNGAKDPITDMFLSLSSFALDSFLLWRYTPAAPQGEKWKIFENQANSSQQLAISKKN
jgi:hypothetical protein